MIVGTIGSNFLIYYWKALGPLFQSVRLQPLFHYFDRAGVLFSKFIFFFKLSNTATIHVRCTKYSILFCRLFGNRMSLIYEKKNRYILLWIFQLRSGQMLLQTFIWLWDIKCLPLHDILLNNWNKFVIKELKIKKLFFIINLIRNYYTCIGNKILNFMLHIFYRSFINI